MNTDDSSEPAPSPEPSVERAADQVRQRIDDIERMKRNVEDFRNQQERLRDAMRSIDMTRPPTDPAGSGPPPGAGAAPSRPPQDGATDDPAPGVPGQQPGATDMPGLSGPPVDRDGGVGGLAPGSGRGNAPGVAGDHGKAWDYNVRREREPTKGEGRVISRWLERGPMRKGEAALPYDQAVKEARSDAERAVSDDHVPKRYHEGVKKYFDQLPKTPEASGGSSPAPAPNDQDKASSSDKP